MFDCASGGVRNMDIEIIQFVIQVNIIIDIYLQYTYIM